MVNHSLILKNNSDSEFQLNLSKVEQENAEEMVWAVFTLRSGVSQLCDIRTM